MTTFNRYFRFSLLLVALAFTGLLTGCTTITPGNVGIEVSKVGQARGAQDLPIRSGLVAYNPLFTEIIEYPVFVQTVKWTASTDEGSPRDESITFTTKDSLVVNADVSLSYQLNQDKAAAFYVKFRQDNIQGFTDGYLRNVVRDSFNEIAGNYTVEQIMGDNGPILKQVQIRIQGVVGKDGIDISQLGLIGAPRPPQSVTGAINAKVQAEQIALQKQNEVAQAQAEALKREADAEGVAKSNLIMAQSDAQANKLKTEGLTPLLVEWKKIDKWDGHLPEVEAGANTMLSIPK